MENTGHELRELTRMKEELGDETTAWQNSTKAAMGVQELAPVGEYKIT